MPNCILRLLVFFQFILIYEVTLAQAIKPYDKNGYVVELNGDTIPGYLEYSVWEKCPKKISFKKGANDVSTKYFPSNILGFEVAGRKYISRTVQVEISSRDIGVLGGSKDFIFEPREVFLEALVTGEKSLFHYVNLNKNDYFYIEENGQLRLLKYKKYLNDNMVKENAEYVNQLKDYLDLASTEQMPYEKDRLMLLFKSYYIERNIEPAFYYKINSTAVDESWNIVEISFPSFKNGYVVLNNGDTLKGNINDGYWYGSPEKIHFQHEDIDSGVVEFNMSDLRAVEVGDRKFLRAKVDVLVGVLSLESMDQSRDVKTENKEVVLEVLVDRDKKLYSYLNEADNRRSFYILLNGQIVLLIHTKYLKYLPGTVENLIIENKKFVGQLTYYLSDCSKYLKTSKLEYRSAEILRFFKKYYECRDKS